MKVRFWSDETPQKQKAVITFDPDTARKARRMSDHELLNWMNVMTLELGAAFDDFRHHGRTHEEVGRCLTILGVLYAEVVGREQEPST